MVISQDNNRGKTVYCGLKSKNSRNDWELSLKRLLVPEVGSIEEGNLNRKCKINWFVMISLNVKGLLLPAAENFWKASG